MSQQSKFHRPGKASHQAAAESATVNNSMNMNELSALIQRLLEVVSGQLQAAIVSQVDALLKQELANLARSQDAPIDRIQKPNPSYAGDRIVRAKEFRFRSGLGKTMFHEIQKQGGPYFDEAFPKKVVPRAGGRAIGYRESDVTRWINKSSMTKEM